VTDDPFTACAEQVAATPNLVRQLLVDHTPTPDGWCQAHDGHAERHPCSIRRLAELASAYLLTQNRIAQEHDAARRRALAR
jgi:hypothetical protein